MSSSRQTLAFPFRSAYQPTETFTFTASYLPLTNVTLRASQSLGTYWNLYTSYQIVNETYWLSDRVNTQDRLYLFDQRVVLGPSELAFGFSLDLSAAYVFDRSIFQASLFGRPPRCAGHRCGTRDEPATAVVAVNP